MRTLRSSAWCGGLSFGVFLLASASGCTLEDRVLGNDLANFLEGPRSDFDYGPLEPNGCDLTGIYIAEQETQNATLGTGTAIARNWYYYEIRDDGDRFTVTRGWDCGFETGGITSVALFPETTASLVLRNRQDGVIDASIDPPLVEAPRTGYYRPSRDPDKCELYMDRWWWIRGASVDLLPPRDEYQELDVPDMQERKPLPTKKAPEGQEDWDGDGNPGIALEVFKPLRGQRHVVQRDWNEVGPFMVPDGASRFIGPVAFNNQETVLEASSPLLNVGSRPLDEGHTIRFIRVEEKAPTDLDEFVAYCTKVAETFTEMRNAEQGGS